MKREGNIVEFWNVVIENWNILALVRRKVKRSDITYSIERREHFVKENRSKSHRILQKEAQEVIGWQLFIRNEAQSDQVLGNLEEVEF